MESPALSVDGSWIQSAGPNRRWQGVITYSQAHALLVTVALPDRIVWAKSRTPGDGALNAYFYLHDLGQQLAAGTQVMFRVGDGWAQDAVVVLPRLDYVPCAAFPILVQPHVWTELFRLESEPLASVGFLAIPRSEVKIGRTGVWRARGQISPSVAPELRAAFESGRHGILARGNAA